MQKEIWKDVKGYEGLYQVSNLGRVKSLPREWVGGYGAKRSHNGKILSQNSDGRGYLQVVLSKSGSYITKKVHKLVAISFLGHEPNGHKLVVDHIDNNKSNNTLKNLQIITTRENISKDIVGSASKYTGVSFHRHKNKWRARISVNGKQEFLGYFDCEIEASKAYQNRLSELMDYVK